MNGMTAIAETSFAWSSAERAAWAPPERLSPAEWAERYRTLGAGESDIKGPWRNANAPYLVGIMDIGSGVELRRHAAARPVRTIVIVKPAQVGVSEALRNLMLYWGEREPDPVMVVLPTEESGAKIFARKIKPAFEKCAALELLQTGEREDATKKVVRLANGYTLILAWSGSPTALASEPCRAVLLDEVDKYPPFSGNEADPVALGEVRIRTYRERGRQYLLSTPTTRGGLIWQHAERCAIRLHYLAPCPTCERLQILTFEQLQFEHGPEVLGEDDRARRMTNAEWAQWMQTTGRAWMKCKFCAAEIEEAETLAAGGVWGVAKMEGRRLETLDVSAGTICYEAWPAGNAVAMFVSPFSCQWLPWRMIAAEFIAAKDDPAKLMGFFNGTLGRPFEAKIGPSAANMIREKTVGAAPARTVPGWARKVIATVDVQLDHFYYVVRAWGYLFRSQRIEHGRCATWAELERILLGGSWPEQADGAGRRYVCELVGVDAGYRTEEVYRFSLRHLHRVYALKGEDNAKSALVRGSRVSYLAPGSKYGPLTIWLQLFWADGYRDKLAARMPALREEQGVQVQLWALNSDDDPDYARQMLAWHKSLTRRKGAMVEAWTKPEGAPDHYFSCEVMQMVCADLARVELLPPEMPAAATPRTTPRRHAPAAMRREYGSA